MKSTLNVLARASCLLLIAGCSATQTVPEPAAVSMTTDSAYDQEVSLARLSERQGKTDQATKIYEAIVRRHPSHGVAHHRLGVLAARRGSLDKAINHFQKAQLGALPSPELLNDLGYAYYLKTDLSTARAIYARGLELGPNDLRLRNNMGIVMAEQGQFEDALNQFRQVVETEVEALSNLAYAQSQSGYLREAEMNYHRVLEADPTQRAAVEAIVQLQERRKTIEEIAKNSSAEQSIASSVAIAPTEAANFVNPIAEIVDAPATGDAESVNFDEAASPKPAQTVAVEDFQTASLHVEPNVVSEPPEKGQFSIEGLDHVQPVAIEAMPISPSPAKPLSIEPLTAEPLSAEPVSVEPASTDLPKPSRFGRTLNLHFSG